LVAVTAPSPPSLEGFVTESFDHEGAKRTVYTRGEGPGVVVMHEVPGITPEVAGFSRRVADAGFTVFMPHLFGTPGRRLTASYGLASMVHCCVSREFATLASRRSSLVTDWLRALCRHAHARCGGPGVGAIGMCMTGNFALALMVDDAVMAPVLSQPSLPLGLTKARRAALHVTDDDLVTIKSRAAAGCPVLGLRFTHDLHVPAARFERLRRELGDAFEGIEIDSGPGNPHGIRRTAHSVVTADLVDEDGHPTQVALHRVLSFFHERLDP
jgi:dienelactone hydrolase